MKALAVFCGANFNGDPVLKSAVDALAKTMVNQGISLIFGGGKIGIMGLLADAVLERGGKAIGVMPAFLLDKEIGHPSLTTMHVVENMHQRKQKMHDLADGVMTLPGGFGTLEEFFEVLTWLQLNLHRKPVALLNVNGFYDFLLKQMDVMVAQQLLNPTNRKLVLTSADPSELISMMRQFTADGDDQWMNRKHLA